MTPGLAALLFEDLADPELADVRAADVPEAAVPEVPPATPVAAIAVEKRQAPSAAAVRRDDLQDLRRLHAELRASKLAPHEAARYSKLVSGLLESAVAAQNATLRLRERPRKAVRIRRALPVEVSWGGEVHRGLTLDVGTGGCSALLRATPPREVAVVVRLQLARGEHVMPLARVAGVRERRGAARVSFAFENLGEADRQRLERSLVEDVIFQVESLGELR